ncbi:hypothetical protein AURDEDRAFT_116284 [Auricularia subglabra TFB-10046 SS5]|uniref:DUF92-domain-containing protein n=1 Tax=Auricularia subglabra (strain TFB-10046 / SS5) TaxID=717982 RepID=J0LIN8_AURST|nr:hypothetical protein AURDEDRAFT_116284 [Auricularia subglabra TFB-10046 SS5]
MVKLGIWDLDQRAVANHPATCAAIALYVSYKGWRRGSLSASGALTAFVVGFVLIHAQTKAFGAAMLVFFFTGSKATRMGKERKAKLEDGHAIAGNRNGRQVLCNSFPAIVATVLWSAFFAPTSPYAGVLGLLPEPWTERQAPYTPAVWCPDARVMTPSRALSFAVLGHFSCTLGDTLASELGILSKSWPILITTGKRVPPGTNGGLSVLGTFASLMGGVIIGASMAAVWAIESSACAREGGELWVRCLAWGAASGLLGSIIDSLLGATVQRTRYDKENKLIMQDDGADREGVAVISGLNLLTNNQINLVSAALTAVIVGFLA